VYVPTHFEETDLGVLHELIRSHVLGAWVAPAAAGLLVNHLPFLLDAGRGEHGTLTAHVARANPAWRGFSAQQESVVIFQGPQDYISPSWYASKQTHGKVVPTWNYVVVHAHGVPRVIDDKSWLLEHVSRQSELHESRRGLPWRVSDAPREFIDSMLEAIVGIEIPITKIVGKWKLSQNRSADDRQGVVDALEARGDAASKEMARLVAR
jgi:transcriptional regulator